MIERASQRREHFHVSIVGKMLQGIRQKQLTLSLTGYTLHR